MSRPRPLAACEHVRDGTRPHHSKGQCAACYHRAIYVPRRPTLLSQIACPTKYCTKCGRRIGDSCAVCEPARVGLDGPDARAAAWVRGAG